MNIYAKIRTLNAEQMQAAWTENSYKGDCFSIRGCHYTVVVHTPKTFRLKDEKGRNYTFKRYGHRFAATGKEANLFRDCEGEIIRDLLNQHNPLHETSDVFKMTAKLFD